MRAAYRSPALAPAGQARRRAAIGAACTLALCLATPAADAAAPRRVPARVSVHVSDRTTVGTSRLWLGVTHTQVGIGGGRKGLAQIRDLLGAATRFQNQHLYGWGAANPQPAPGRFAWASLDRRMARMRAVGTEPVITLCCAPDWMTRLRRRSSTYPTLPPTARHVRDFAALAAAVARRYPDVRYFIVWNQMKGYYLRRSKTWDVAAYTRLYNAVYSALKRVSPRIKVGGPYLSIEGSGSKSFAKRPTYATDRPITERNRAVLSYWLRHKRGADFVAISRPLIAPDHDHNRYSTAELLGLVGWFGDVARQIRAMTRLPLWYAEDHVRPLSGRAATAGEAVMLMRQMLAGVAVSLRWGPQAPQRGTVWHFSEALYGRSRATGGVRPLAFYPLYRAVHSYFSPGTTLFRVRTSSPVVQAVASRRAALVVNTLARALAVSVDGRRLRLPGYGVRVVALTR